MKEPKMCLLIFTSGKIVVTGAKTREFIEDAFKKMKAVLREFRKTDLRDQMPMK
jgi:transcription initiation factor TFIID TATA-box-binding protein|tara:strand:- start:198 stop:359 length:162 start_codon:yes stop_codon:yes gene_type:complete